MPSPSEALLRVVCLLDKHEGISGEDWREGLRALGQIGWKHESERVEPAPAFLKARGREEVRPWYTSPTGESVRGLKQVFRQAVESPPQELPSTENVLLAARVVAALQRDPELLGEVRRLLLDV